MHESWNFCVVFTNPSYQWKIDKCDMMVYNTILILLHILSKGYILRGNSSCLHIHIYRNISNNLLGKKKFLLHQVMYIIIEFVNTFSSLVTIKLFLEYSIFQRNYFFEMSKILKIIRERKI